MKPTTTDTLATVQTTALHDGSLKDLIAHDQNIRNQSIHHIISSRLKANKGETTPTLEKKKTAAVLAMGGLPPTKSASFFLDSSSSTKKAAHPQHHCRPSGYSLMDPALDPITSTTPTSSTPSQMQDRRPLETTSLHSESRAATSSLWVLHLHVAKVEKLPGYRRGTDPYVQVSICHRKEKIFYDTERKMNLSGGGSSGSSGSSGSGGSPGSKNDDSEEDDSEDSDSEEENSDSNLKPNDSAKPTNIALTPVAKRH